MDASCCHALSVELDAYRQQNFGINMYKYIALFNEERRDFSFLSFPKYNDLFGFAAGVLHLSLRLTTLILHIQIKASLTLFHAHNMSDMLCINKATSTTMKLKLKPNKRYKNRTKKEKEGA
ncbi:hypothetical protein ACJX0J_014624, partial [Zea mays]